MRVQVCDASFGLERGLDPDERTVTAAKAPSSSSSSKIARACGANWPIHDSVLDLVAIPNFFFADVYRRLSVYACARTHLCERASVCVCVRAREGARCIEASAVMRSSSEMYAVPSTYGSALDGSPFSLISSRGPIFVRACVRGCVSSCGRAGEQAGERASKQSGRGRAG